MLRVKFFCMVIACVVAGFGCSENRGLASDETVQISFIVVPAESQPVEGYAAGELAKYIEKMTGLSLAVVKEGEAKPQGRAIILGRTETNLAKYNPDSWPLDTIYIGYGEGDIAIIGQGDQGTLFAAYEFLRDQGCRWYMPMDIGECIPKRALLALGGKPKKHTPSFVDRGWHPIPDYQWFADYSFDWAVRNGVNAYAHSPIIEYSPTLGYGRQKRLGHMLIGLIPTGDHPDTVKTFAAHPEWYPLVNGKRVTEYKDGRPSQGCLSNPEAVKEVAKKAIKYFREHPRCWLFSIAHNDEPSYWCECEACIAMDGPDSTWRVNDVYDAYPLRSKHGPGPMSRRYVKFTNQVAQIVNKELPGKCVSICSYGSIEVPPKGDDWELESNVIVEYSHGCEQCYRHALDDPACATNTNMSKWIKGWAKKGKVIYYDYPPMGPNPNFPSVFTHSYKRYLVGLKKLGVIGLSGETQTSWGGSALFFHIKSRLLWDIDADVDELVAEFCHDMYGAAEPVMLKFYNTFEEKLQTFEGHLVWGRWVADIDEQTMQTLSSLLAEALQKADSELAKKRVMMMQVCMNNLMINKLENDPTGQKDASVFVRYKELIAETVQMIEELDQTIPLVVTSQWIDKLKRGAYRPPFEALGGKEMLTLPIVWRFRTDPANEGIKAEWSKTPNSQSSDWTDIRVDSAWTEQGFEYHGAAWYVTDFVVPNKPHDRLWILFGAIDGDGEVWINGQPAGKLALEPWDKPKGFDITDIVKPGEKSQLVIRVQKAHSAAGVWKPVKIMAVFERIGDR